MGGQDVFYLNLYCIKSYMLIFCQETDPKKLAINYRRQNRFLADVLSTIPLQYVVNFCIGKGLLRSVHNLHGNPYMIDVKCLEET